MLRLVERQSTHSNAVVLFVSLRETAEERRRPRLSVVTLTPDMQIALVKEVVGA